MKDIRVNTNTISTPDPASEWVSVAASDAATSPVHTSTPPACSGSKCRSQPASHPAAAQAGTCSTSMIRTCARGGGATR